jgi:hypothetical protein
MDRNFLSGCIYTQVYLSAMLFLKKRSHGVAPDGIVFVGGDGENFFGKNQSAIKSDQLSNRQRVESNLKYQQFLLSVIDEISDKSGLPITKYFWREYSIRLISYGIRVRSLGFRGYLSLINTYFNFDVRKSLLISCVFLFVIFVPARIAGMVYSFGVARFRKSG